MPRPTSAADQGLAAMDIRVVIVTMDSHVASAVGRARAQLSKRMPALTISVHAAAEWCDDAQALERCRQDIARADILVVSMLFMEDHYTPVLEALRERRAHCDAMVAILSAPEVTRLTKMGRFDMSAPTSA